MLDIDVGYKTATDTENWRRTRIPRARPLLDLLEVVTPNIYSTEAGSEGYKVAQHAWDVMSKNYYFTEGQKEYICNMIAREIDEINALVAKETQSFEDEGEPAEYTHCPAYLHMEPPHIDIIIFTQPVH